MLRIETDGTVTADGLRIGEVKLDDERHRFKIGGILRDTAEDKLEAAELDLAATEQELLIAEQSIGDNDEASATLEKIRELVA